MQDKANLSEILDALNLGVWQYHATVGSTNDLALAWAREGAPDWSLVLADQQTAGRGRFGRDWVTKPGAALAISLVLRPSLEEQKFITRFTALAALGLVQALESLDLHAEIKWPNDVLLAGKKVAGVLVEVDWQGASPTALVVGMGVNVNSASIPDIGTRYPATSVEDSLKSEVDRWSLLGNILRAIQVIRPMLITDSLIEQWNAKLDLRGKWSLIDLPKEGRQRMKVLGVTPDGKLALQRENGQYVDVIEGEIVMIESSD